MSSNNHTYTIAMFRYS